MLIDSHAHLTTRQYKNDRDEVIARCFDEGLVRFVEIGAVSEFEGNDAALTLAEKYDEVYCTLGVHPHDAKVFNEAEWKLLCETAASHPKVVGIGETGLDYFYNHSTPMEQKAVFRRHIQLAKELGKPLVIHDRDAHDDVMTILEEENAFDGPGEFHCFSGDVELARKVVEKGWYLALGGVVTFSKATELHEVAREIPLEHIMLETDSPFLTPVPRRGKRNEPWYVKFVAQRIAELKNVPVERVIEITGKNAVTLFGLGLNNA